MGAIASKKASESSPVRTRIASASDGEVSGPVATIALVQSLGGGRRFRPVRFDQRFGLYCGADRLRKTVPVDRERAARRHLVCVGGGEDDRGKAPHLFMQKADRRGLRVVGTERVGANEFRQAAGTMHLGGTLRPHFMQYRRHPGAGDLPGRFRAGKTAADDMDRGHTFAAARALWRFTRVNSVCMPASLMPSASIWDTVL